MTPGSGAAFGYTLGIVPHMTAAVLINPLNPKLSIFFAFLRVGDLHLLAQMLALGTKLARTGR